jgi:hypothetical protein
MTGELQIADSPSFLSHLLETETPTNQPVKLKLLPDQRCDAESPLGPLDAGDEPVAVLVTKDFRGMGL